MLVCDLSLVIDDITVAPFTAVQLLLTLHSPFRNTKTAFFHLCNISRLCSCLSPDAKTLVHAFNGLNNKSLVRKLARIKQMPS